MSKNQVFIVCPKCKLALNSLDDGTQCQCGFKVSSLAGVPILRENEQNERLDYYSGGKLLPRMNSEHLNIPRIRNAFKRGDFMLELGAGVDICDNANLIKTDAFIYSPNLDYVVDAHSMPFADNTFDFVYSLAVFEHLHSPWVAAKEILRVLKPGGKVYILTAFMQHLHGYPHHYFNMTTMGLKRIFSEFEVIKCTPSPHCPLTQVGHIMDDLRVMTFALPNNENAQKLNIHLSAACSLIPIVQEDLIKEESNFDKWHMIAPGIELFAKKPLF